MSPVSLEGGVCGFPPTDVQDTAGKMGLEFRGVNLVPSAYSHVKSMGLVRLLKNGGLGKTTESMAEITDSSEKE